MKDNDEAEGLGGADQFADLADGFDGGWEAHDDDDFSLGTGVEKKTIDLLPHPIVFLQLYQLGKLQSNLGMDMEALQTMQKVQEIGEPFMAMKS
mmetsp:Transcript_25503/g.39285  ORF Transcript_25503/g.39285 Transcript_25503/m.39285 type:complete len:94 (+) Transcript_25503:1338-1619(+)|eukprot:CAMPEP_0170512260 /NCGR_PEP_ID=MMETSP0208-20121228/66754_1 /TAXON_ID=197538 /ORGANISM="Strombidium inclinatum, Strain S3" /LENGTH=93 /DNA_ID=CAMNT_0010795877 /DNA_START=1342 /DNA_END=1623 /DNA_ORIENTATION=-